MHEDKWEAESVEARPGDGPSLPRVPMERD
jgi:hypothetical protein